MAYKLSQAAFLKGLKKKEGVKTLKGGAEFEDEALFFTNSLPDSYDAPMLEDFIRVLQATKPSDVDDLSDDRIIEMMAVLDRLSACIEGDNRYTNGKLMHSLLSKKGVVTRRRVL